MSQAPSHPRPCGGALPPAGAARGRPVEPRRNAPLLGLGLLVAVLAGTVAWPCSAAPAPWAEAERETPRVESAQQGESDDPPEEREEQADAPSRQAPPPMETLPGYFDFDALDLLSRDELEVHISVKGALLQLVAKASNDDPELSGLLDLLRGIDVRVYDISEERRPEVNHILDRTAAALGTEGWQPAITVRVQRDHGYAFLRYVGNDRASLPVGLAAMYLTDGNQVVFVNIVGQLDTATIASLARRFDLDLLAVVGSAEPDEADPAGPGQDRRP